MTRIVNADLQLRCGDTPGAKNARQVWSHRRSLWLKLTDNEGNTGHGEASPLPGYTIDDVADVETCLQRFPWTELSKLPERTEARAWVAEVVGSIPSSLPSARCCVEAALLELLSLRYQVPIGNLIGTQQTSLPLAYLVPAIDEEQALSEAKARFDSGVTTLKVKVGSAGKFEKELTFLRNLRARLGDSLRLRIDANQGLGGAGLEQGLEQRLAALTELDPEFVEEPATPDELSTIAIPPCPLAVDESLFGTRAGPFGAESLIDAKRYRFAILKPMALGGIQRCIELASRAQQSGARVVVTHTLDGPIGWCVAATLALAVQDGDLAAGLAPHAGLDAWPSHRLIGQEHHRIHAHTGLGWGVDWAAT